MKHSYLYIIVIALLIASCSGNKQSFTLLGKFKGLSDGEFMCFSQSPEWGSLDTIKIADGSFSFTHQLTDTAIITLQYPNFMQTQVIAIPGKTAKLRGDANNMKRIVVSGDDENEALSDFNKQTADLNSLQATAEAEKFIRKKPHLWASIALLDKFFIQAQRPDFAKISNLLTLMLKSRPNRSYLHTIEQSIAPIARCKVGAGLPAFNATTIKGERINNATFKGKAILITFWSTMTNDHIYPIVNQRHLMRSLSDKIAQINICLDTDTSSCMRVLRTDTIGGYNVCDRQTFNSPLVTTFGMPQLPSNILVDSRGVIRARDIEPNNLENVLRSIGITK